MDRINRKLIIERIRSTINCVFGVFWAFVGVNELGSGSRDYALDIGFFILIGAAFLWLGIKRKKRIKLCRSYIQVLAADEINDVNQAASIVGKTPEVVKKEISTLIGRGYFKDVYLDLRTNSIVIGENGKLLLQKAANVAVGEKQYIVVECESCGGKNKIEIGKVGKCEFCGMPIRGNEA